MVEAFIRKVVSLDIKCHNLHQDAVHQDAVHQDAVHQDVVHQDGSLGSGPDVANPEDVSAWNLSLLKWNLSLLQYF